MEQVAACRAHDVERPGDEHGVVGRGPLEGGVARPRHVAFDQHLVAAQGPGRARPTSSAGTARGRRRRAADHRASPSSARSAASISAGSRPRRTRRRPGSRRPGRGEVVVAAPWRSRRRRRGLWAPSTITSGWWPSTSKRPGTCTVAEAPPRTTSRSSGDVEEALDRGQRDGGVVALVAAVERQEHLGVARRSGVRRSSSRPPRASWFSTASKSMVALPDDAPAPRPGRWRPAPGRSRRAPAWSRASRCRPSPRAMSARVGPAYSVWSSPTLVTTATWPSATLVASQRPSSPTSTHGHVDGDVGEPAEGGRGHDLEVATAARRPAPRGRRWRRSARRSPRRRSARRRGRCAR